MQHAHLAARDAVASSSWRGSPWTPDPPVTVGQCQDTGDSPQGPRASAHSTNHAYWQGGQHPSGRVSLCELGARARAAGHRGDFSTHDLPLGEALGSRTIWEEGVPLDLFIWAL